MVVQLGAKMSNGNGTKVWYKSSIVWLLTSALLTTWAGVLTNNINWKYALAASMLEIAAVIRRFYTNTSLTKRSEPQG